MCYKNLIDCLPDAVDLPAIVPVSDSQTPSWLYWLLQVACAYVLSFELICIAEVLSRREELAQLIPAFYRARILMQPFVFSGLVVYGWMRFFRREREGARVAALMAVIALWLFSLVMWLNAAVNDLHYARGLMLGYPLAGLVFLIYAFRGRENRR